MKLVFFSTWGLWITSALSSLTSTPCITCGCSWLRWPGPKTSSETLWMVRCHFIVLLKRVQWSPACVFMLWLFLRCDITSSEGIHTAAVVTVTHWSSAAWQHHQTGLYEKHFSLMTYRKGRSVSRQVETIPVKINEPCCFLSTVCFGYAWWISEFSSFVCW